ncbi:flavoprotein [Xylariaceae sp. FL1651]|nr:flavoprotein [Xylariaceae sp. FL1651]
MLQAISSQHDTHHARSSRTSLEALTASLSDGKAHLLLACSGSVATIKLPNMIRALSKYPSSRLSIRVILTPSASRFLAGQSHEQPPISALSDLPNVDAVVCGFLPVQVYVDADEWKAPWIRGSGILHIELRRWADVLVIAPLSANTMAKIVGGFADSLLTSVVRAWDPWGELDASTAPNPTATAGDVVTAAQGSATVIPMTQQGTGAVSMNRRVKKRHIIVAPAKVLLYEPMVSSPRLYTNPRSNPIPMRANTDPSYLEVNTAMWRHPVTAKQLRVLEEEWGVQKPGSYTDAQPDRSATTESEHSANQTAEQPNHKTGDDENEGWFEVLRPQRKILACGDAGDGAMIEWSQIVAVMEERLGLEDRS